MTSTAHARRRPRAPEKLADRLVAVTEALLESDGLEGLTLREVARRAGVTHGAPQRHFASFATLLAEVATRGFDSLIEAMDASAATVPAGSGALARLAACAHAYVRCAVARPHVFALMFRPELLDSDHEQLALRSRASFEQLLYYVRAAQDAGWHTAQDTRQLAGVLWATVHGLASLWAQKALPTVVPGASLDGMLASTIDLMLANADLNPKKNPQMTQMGKGRRNS